MIMGVFVQGSESEARKRLPADMAPPWKVHQCSLDSCLAQYDHQEFCITFQTVQVSGTYEMIGFAAGNAP